MDLITVTCSNAQSSQWVIMLLDCTSWITKYGRPSWIVAVKTTSSSPVCLQTRASFNTVEIGIVEETYTREDEDELQSLVMFKTQGPVGRGNQGVYRISENLIPWSNSETSPYLPPIAADCANDLSIAWQQDNIKTKAAFLEIINLLHYKKPNHTMASYNKISIRCNFI